MAAQSALEKTYKEKAVAQQQALPPVLVETMTGIMPQIPALLPPDITLEQFRSALFLELSGRPQLAECTRASLRDAVIKAAMYGMLPGRDCHVLPFKNRKGNTRQATYVPNYFGIILALERTGKIDDAFAHPVYEGDEFVCDHLAPRYHHVPSYARTPPREQGAVRFYYGCILLKNGKKHVEPMTLKQIDAIRRRAPAHDEGPWVTDFDEMARKTALKHAAKYVRLTHQQSAMLEEDDERERQDIPVSRTQQHVHDMFGPGTDPTLPSTDVTSSPTNVNPQTGEIVEDEPPLFGWDDDDPTGAHTVKGSAVEG